MNKNIILTFTALYFTTLLSFAQERIKLKGVLMKNDYHEKISWVKSKPVTLESKDFTVSTLSTTYIQIYFGMMDKDGIPFLTNIRLVNHFDDKDWIFFDEVSYLLGSRKEIRERKGTVFKVKVDKTVKDVKGEVIEHSDIIASDQAKDFINYIINNEETRLSVRFTNNEDSQYREFVIKSTKKLKKYFTALIDSYNKLCEAYGL